MSALDLVIAALPEAQLTLGGLLKCLRQQGRLEPLVREALTAQFLREQARQAGLSVTDEELQAAADDFRRRHGQETAADIVAWLAARRISVDDFEANLEQEVLVAKLSQQRTAAEVDDYFAAHQADFEQLWLTQVIVGREDLARELACQINEEGRELKEVAEEQGLPLERLEMTRREVPGSLGFALGAARVGQLVGPVGTPRGFALVVIEDSQPTELDSPTRQHIQDQLFASWLTARMQEMTLILPQTGIL